MPINPPSSEAPNNAPNESTTESDSFWLKSERARRQKFMDTASNMLLPDAVFSIMLYHQRYWPAVQKQIPGIELSELFPSISRDQLAELCARGSGLLRSAYSAGDSHLSSKFTNRAELIEQLAVEHPGFSTTSYDAAIEYGCHLAR
jgi:hypothetical protein